MLKPLTVAAIIAVIVMLTLMQAHALIKSMNSTLEKTNAITYYQR